MKQKLYRTAIELTNGPATSGALRRFSRSSMSKKLIKDYIATYRIDTVDIEKPVASYNSLHDFFIRKLRQGARPIADTEVVSPVDGKVEAAGDLTDGLVFFVKNRRYSLASLLGSEEAAARFHDGKYVVLYLSPADYHRIHSPVTGEVQRQYTLGKKSYPVNRAGLVYGKSPISGNYRLVSSVASAAGEVLVVKVGAMFVNSIERTNLRKQWQKGEEVAYFGFGSTVVLFFERGKIEFAEGIQHGRRVKMGEALARVL